MFTYLKIGAVVAVLLAAFGGGWKTRDAFCDAAAAKAENAGLKAQIALLTKRAETAEAISSEDRKRAEADAAEIARLQKLIDETPENTATCGDPDMGTRIDEVK